jgi:hypothetical protein
MEHGLSWSHDAGFRAINIQGKKTKKKRRACGSKEAKQKGAGIGGGTGK